MEFPLFLQFEIALRQKMASKLKQLYIVSISFQKIIFFKKKEVHTEKEAKTYNSR